MEIGKRFLIEIQSLHCYKTNLFLMPRPKTKEELLSASTAAYCQLCSMLDSMPANELEQEHFFEFGVLFCCFWCVHTCICVSMYLNAASPQLCMVNTNAMCVDDVVVLREG